MTKRILLSASAAVFAGVILFAYAGAQDKGHEHAHPAAAVPALPAPGKTMRPEEVRLYVSSPRDGAEVKPTFTVRFGLKGMGVAPAGIYISDEMPTGHHHLLVDVAELPTLTLPLLKDDNHLHFGGGQTETELTLPPGEHTLQLVLGDHSHIPHDPPVVSRKITITVTE